MELQPEIFQNNREWAAQMLERDPQFFAQLAEESRGTVRKWVGCRARRGG